MKNSNINNDNDKLISDKLTVYGSISNTILYKNIWRYILLYLPEKEWHKLKFLNWSFYRLIKELCIIGDIKELASKNLIECYKIRR